jgi:hypothetical protein
MATANTAAQNQSICKVNSQKRLLNIPLIRMTTTSPYSNSITGESTGLTPTQLDMRRKAEILKYSSNRMPNQTNNLTKKQKWSRLVTQPVRGTIRGDENCAGDISIPRPTSASGVPGPQMYLYEDPAVPLYNYIITRTYAYNVPNPNSYWETTVNTNVGLLHGVGAGLFTLNILPNINKPTYSYLASTPIGLHVEGRVIEGLSMSSINAIRVSIATATLTVFCNGVNILQKTSTQNEQLYIDFTPVQQTNPEIRVISTTKMAGSLYFSGIELNTSPVYTFQFALTLTFGVSYVNGTPININSIFETNTFRYYAYGNLTDAIPLTSTNCVVSFPVVDIPLELPLILGT